MTTASGLHSSGSSAPSEIEKLRALREMTKEHPWMLNMMANPRLVAGRTQGHDGPEDTPPPSLSMFCDELPVSPPAGPRPSLDLTTPPRQMEHDSPPPELLPPTINESPTQPPAPVTSPACGTPNPSSPPATNTTQCTDQVHRLARRPTGSK